MIKGKIFRMIDANLNRATEGLRVAEDIVRFVLDDGQMTARLKSIRHGISKIFRSIEVKRFRDVRRDVGARKTSRSEAKRSNILEVFMANIKRAEESVRVFEEISKLYDPKLGPKFKKLRFELYEIEQKAALSLKKKIKLDSPLYVITDNSFGHSHFQIMEEASKAGARIFQYREKRKGTRDKISEAKKLSNYAKAHGLTFIVNDDFDIAKRVDADGVHLGASCQVSGASEWQKAGKILGISASNLAEAKRAERLGADYIGFGPVFGTPIKPSTKPSGIKELRRVTKRVTIPVVAIGGINCLNIRQVFEAGAHSAAVIRAVAGSKDVRKAVRSLLLLSRRPR